MPQPEIGLAVRMEPDETEMLRRKVRRLEEELNNAHIVNRSLKAKAAANEEALQSLRKVLEPMYSAFRMVFGELDAAGVQSEGPQSSNNRASGVWESWKSKLGGKCAEIITALQEHGQMSVAQLRVAAHCGQQTVYDVTVKLHKLGLINRDGGKYSLREL